MSEPKKGEKINEGIFGMIDSLFEKVYQLSDKHLGDKPILLLAVISLMIMTGIIALVVVFDRMDAIVLCLVLLFMIFVIIMAIISIKVNPQTRIEIIDPKKGRTYKEVWGNFKGVFYAFNSPWELEKEYTEQQKQSTYSVIRELYNDKNFNVKYLFFTGENDEEKKIFKQWINNFQEFFGNIETAKLGDNFRIYLIENERIPDYTFFVGKKNGKDCAVLYPFREYGLPKDAFLIHDAIFVKSLKSIFEEALKRAKAQKGEIKTWNELESLIKEI